MCTVWAMFTVWLPTAYSIDRPICQRRTVSGRPYQHFAQNMADGRLLYCALHSIKSDSFWKGYVCTYGLKTFWGLLLL